MDISFCPHFLLVKFSKKRGLKRGGDCTMAAKKKKKAAKKKKR
jgi:hypothetical protein